MYTNTLEAEEFYTSYSVRTIYTNGLEALHTYTTL